MTIIGAGPVGLATSRGRAAALTADLDLRRDPVMAGLIDDFGGPLPAERDSRGRPAELYGALVRTIAGQQLSVLAARAIWGRLLEHFDGRMPTPQEILGEDPESCAPRRASRAPRSSTCARSPSTCSPGSSSSTASPSCPTTR